MEDEIKRYRISPKQYLCITPEEAVSTGITVGEEMLEEIALIKSQGFGYKMYASIREIPEDKLKEIAMSERKERLFDNRKEAVRYIAENNADNSLFLYAVKDTRMVDRREIGRFEDMPVEDFMSQLKDFDKGGA
ncbi:MAG: hypothetical protein JW957_02905 [Candidatus Omnitrophica bacterium]|nr:hypothetical protein [Candidatus Omnitrophota bacterium]